ncbi:unnamed protein product [[Candida] boidinii]|nr:unnamed protein product [[Candida] boidinii]
MSLNIVSNNGLPPDDPAVLIKESQNYEFSTSVPLNIWLNASSRMIKHGHSFASQGLIGDAYVLYSKFIDLFVKKLSKHPDLNVYKNNFKRSGILTKEGKSYKQYLELRKNLPPLMEECEKFKKILNDNYNSYLKLTNDQQNEYTNNGSSINKLISNRDKRYSNSSAISSNSSIGGSVTSGGKRRTSVVRGSFSDNSSGANKYSSSNSNYVNDIKLLKQIRSLSMNSDGGYNNGSAISNIDEFPSYPDTFNLSSLQSSLSDLSTLTSSNNIKPPALPEKKVEYH